MLPEGKHNCAGEGSMNTVDMSLRALPKKVMVTFLPLKSALIIVAFFKFDAPRF
jgi:hypothetical protein